MNGAAVIQIVVTGPVQVGKSPVLASIKAMLEGFGYCVATPSREERNNPSPTLENGESHQIPSREWTVFVLTESVREG